MIIPVFILFGIIAFLYLKEVSCFDLDRIILVPIFLAMLAIITWRPVEMADAVSYIDDYTGYTPIDRLEPFYALLRNIVAWFGVGYRGLFLVVGFIALSLKFTALEKLSPFFYGSLLVYISNFFILHDMIQIRVGIASSLALFAYQFAIERKLTQFIIITVIATSFHYSSLAVIPMWFVPLLTIPRFVWLLIIPACYILAYSGVLLGSLLSYIPISFIQKLWMSYQNSMENDKFLDINLLSLILLARIFIISYLIIFVNKIKPYFHNIESWLLIYTLSVVVFILCSDIPIISWRIGAYLQVVEIVVIPLITYTLRDRIAAKIVVISIAAILLLIITFVDQHLL